MHTGTIAGLRQRACAHIRWRILTSSNAGVPGGPEKTTLRLVIVRGWARVSLLAALSSVALRARLAA